MWYVYLLICNDKHHSLYCGISNDVDKRVEKHNKGKGAKYTRSHLPVKLIWKRECKSKSHALKLEYKIKQMSRHKKLIFISEERI